MSYFTDMRDRTLVGLGLGDGATAAQTAGNVLRDIAAQATPPAPPPAPAPTAVQVAPVAKAALPVGLLLGAAVLLFILMKKKRA